MHTVPERGPDLRRRVRLSRWITTIWACSLQLAGARSVLGGPPATVRELTVPERADRRRTIRCHGSDGGQSRALSSPGFDGACRVTPDRRRLVNTEELVPPGESREFG
jgi:hypothetical protein